MLNVLGAIPKVDYRTSIDSGLASRVGDLEQVGEDGGNETCRRLIGTSFDFQGVRHPRARLGA